MFRLKFIIRFLNFYASACIPKCLINYYGHTVVPFETLRLCQKCTQTVQCAYVLNHLKGGFVQARHTIILLAQIILPIRSSLNNLTLYRQKETSPPFCKTPFLNIFWSYDYVKPTMNSFSSKHRYNFELLNNETLNYNCLGCYAMVQIVYVYFRTFVRTRRNNRPKNGQQNLTKV